MSKEKDIIEKLEKELKKIGDSITHNDGVDEYIKKEVKLFRKIFFEILRVLPLLIITIPFLFTDDSWKLVMFGISIVTLSLLVMHIVRKTLFPYIDIEVLIKNSLKNPIGAGLSFFGLMILLSTMLYCFILTILK